MRKQNQPPPQPNQSTQDSDSYLNSKMNPRELDAHCQKEQNNDMCQSMSDSPFASTLRQRTQTSIFPYRTRSKVASLSRETPSVAVAPKSLLNKKKSTPKKRTPTSAWRRSPRFLNPYSWEN